MQSRRCLKPAARTLSSSAQKNKAIHAPAMVRAVGDEDKSKNLEVIHNE